MILENNFIKRIFGFSIGRTDGRTLKLMKINIFSMFDSTGRRDGRTLGATENYNIKHFPAFNLLESYKFQVLE